MTATRPNVENRYTRSIQVCGLKAYISKYKFLFTVPISVRKTIFFMSTKRGVKRESLKCIEI